MEGAALESGGLAPPGFVPTEIQTTQDRSQVAEMLASVEVNCRRVERQENVEFLREEPETDGAFVICGNGPSLADCRDRVKALDKPGNRIVAMNNAAPFLHDNGVNVWAGCVWETATAAWCEISKRNLPMRYLVASRAHPDWVAYFRGNPVILWHCRDDVGEREIIDRFDAAPVMIAGGTSHALRSFEIGRAMGYRKFHLFGCDGSYRGGVSHASETVKQPGQHFTAWVDGREFQTCHHWAQHAVDLVNQVKAYEAKEARGEAPFRLVVHGDGLIPAFARHHGIPTL